MARFCCGENSHIVPLLPCARQIKAKLLIENRGEFSTGFPLMPRRTLLSTAGQLAMPVGRLQDTHPTLRQLILSADTGAAALVRALRTKTKGWR